MFTYKFAVLTACIKKSTVPLTRIGLEERLLCLFVEVQTCLYPGYFAVFNIAVNIGISAI